MASNTPPWLVLEGLSNGYMRFGFKGPKVFKDDTDDSLLHVKASNGVDDAELEVATLKTKLIEIFDTGGNKTSITVPTLSADLSLQLPSTAGNAGDKLTTDGNGILSWTSGGDAVDVTGYKYSINFNTSSPIDLLNMVDNTRVKEIVIEVTTAFDGNAPTLTIGVPGDLSSFTLENWCDLTNVGRYVCNVEKSQATAAQMIATLAPDSSTTGAADIYVYANIPS